MPPRRIYGPAPGPDDFRSLREHGYYYVDKTAFIAEVLGREAQVLLIPRPRRFGKSLNLSMLRYFLEWGEKDNRALFEDLAISRAPAEILQHQGQHPVVFLSFKDVKQLNLGVCFEKLRLVIAGACHPHRALMESPAMSSGDQERLERLLACKGTQGETESALRDLTEWLHAHHGREAVLLMDEYDVPIEAGWSYGYYDEIIAFMRNMLGSALKSNPSLFRAVLTGVRRISKESLFSGLNNVEVSSILEPAFATAIGFTEPEVRQILTDAGRPETFDEVRRWYNGYNFGGETIYNPWSVLSFAKHGIIKEYWVSTSSEDLLREIIPTHRLGLRGDFETLLHGEPLEKCIDEHIVLRDLSGNPEAIWSFMLTAGYLKAVSVRWEEGQPWVQIAIPNREVFGVWRRQFMTWLSVRLTGGNQDVAELCRAILSNDALLVQDHLEVLVQRALSFHDTAAGPVEGQGDMDPERVYQAFVLGLLVNLEPKWRVRSNRESGFGRADVLILPTVPGQPGAVLEFKRLRRDRGETPESALEGARKQIADRRYAAEVEAAGASSVASLAIVFEGKQVWVG